GRFVAFSSDATNLLTGAATGATGDHNGLTDVYVRDRIAKTTFRASVVVGGGEIGTGSGAFRPRISADGSVVVYETAASDVVAGDGNGASDVFAHDILSGATLLAS